MATEVGEGARRGITRRGLVGAAAAGAATAALPHAAQAGKRTSKRPAGRRLKADVAIVGAGLAGMTAARRLSMAGARVAVVEARNRVGGRTLNHPIGGGKEIELGGQWIGPGQDNIFRLMEELGVAAYPTYNDGENLYRYQGRTTPFRGAIPPLNPATLGELAVFIRRMDDMASQVPKDAPWKAPDAREWDGQSFESWKSQHVHTQEGRDIIDLTFQAVMATEPAYISLLHLLHYVHCSGGFFGAISVEGGAQESRILGGGHGMCARMAKPLGKRVLLGSPVRRIVQDRGGAEVISDRVTVRAKRVVVTVPPAVCDRIEFEPLLDARRALLHQRLPMGQVVKVQAVYDEPWWREEGLTGQVLTHEGPMIVMFDNSPPDGSPGVLLGFSGTRKAVEVARLSPQQRRAQNLDAFAEFFGDRARRPNDYVDAAWVNDPWTRGCYFGIAPPGVYTDFGESLREPAGRVHWSGSETGREFTGAMEGAVESGNRVAEEVLKVL